MKHKLNVYVAASSKELERAKWAMREIEALGHKISHNWVRCVEEEGEANPAGATVQQCEKWAWDDLLGVEDADVVLLLMPDTGGFGAGVELGWALAQDCYDDLSEKRIICSGPTRRSIFTALADVCYMNDEDAVNCEFRLGY